MSRRLIEADRAGPDAAATEQGGVALPLALIGIAIGGGFLLYTGTAPLFWLFESNYVLTVGSADDDWSVPVTLKEDTSRSPLYVRGLGAPGYPDLPMSERLARAETFRAERPSQAEAMAEAVLPERPEPDPDYATLMERLRDAVAANPDDIAGQRLLARNEAVLGNFAAAAEAQARVIALAGDAATATDYAALADSYIIATGGYVSPEAEQALASALERDPKNGTARFYMGLMWAQTGRPDLAFRFWRGLLEEGPEDAPWIAPIRSRIGMLAAAAGVDYAPPPAPGAGPGPDAADVAAAAEMSAEDRQDMIRSMVDRLSDRLATEGGPPEDWARLISSLGVLGDAERAAKIWAEAQTVFAGNEAGLATVRAAAGQAGVAE